MERVIAACRTSGCTEKELQSRILGAVEATCVQCGIRLNAPELLTLAGAADQPASHGSKIARLRAGYCARKGCNSHYYEFSFQEVPQVVWRDVVAQADRIDERRAAEEYADAKALKVLRWRRRRGHVLRALVGVCLIVFLLLVRHWRDGGAIPIIRPLDELKIDPSSVRVNGVCPSCGEIHSESSH